MFRNALAFVLLCGLATHQSLFLQADAPDGNEGADTGALGGVRADLIFDNIEPNGGLNAGGGSPASQLDNAFPFDAGAVDDFVLPSSPLCTWSLTGIRWSGAYWGPGDPGVITGFRIIFWPDAGGRPVGGGALTPDLSQSLAVYEITGTANETPNAAGALNTFDYRADLPEPFQAKPGVRYWLQIQPNMNFPPQWGWHVTHGRRGSGPVEYFDLLGLWAWTPISDPGDLGFQLMGEPQEIVCDDGNACSEDTCVDGECIFTPITCDDGSACTDDTCDQSSGCIFTDITCNDDSACTIDTCDPAIGCVYTPITCDDGSACTDDTCSPSSGCVFTDITCNDDSACTTDTCDPATGCVYTPITCDDGSACTDDTCDPSSGCVFTDITCNDENACTTDTCDPATGCVYTPIDCDDEDACTIDTCVDGSCAHSTPPDFDGDSDVDLADFVLVFGCMTGSADDSMETRCPCADVNDDGRVDLLDYAAFQTAFTGER